MLVAGAWLETEEGQERFKWIKAGDSVIARGVEQIEQRLFCDNHMVASVVLVSYSPTSPG